MTEGHFLLGTLVLTFMAYAASRAQDARQTPPYCGAPVATEDGWSIATPEDVGFDPAALCQWSERRIATPRDNIHAILVVRQANWCSNSISQAMTSVGAAPSDRSPTTGRYCMTWVL